MKKGLWVTVIALFFWASAALAGTGEFGGIGLQVVPVSTGELVVLRVVDKTPAAGSDIRPGDLIVEVDGFSLRGSDFKEVVPKKLWGKPGTAVVLRFLRPGEKGLREVVLHRTSMKPGAVDLPGVKMITPK